MPVKKPSAKPSKAQKTVSAKAARPVAKPAAKAASKPVTAREKAVPRKTVTAAARPAPKPAPAKTKRARAPEPVTGATRAADADFEMNPSLLSGPRNVQPYQISKGEEYMSKEQLQHFRTILSSWKQDLMQEVDRTVLHMKDEAANFPDPNDRATQESEFSLELRTRDRERKLIRKIDEALKRIEDGSYGYCLETGEPIGVKRLEARPVATLSVEAQERRERREKQFGDRDDFYR
jgi:DnaK suppressor protein